MGQHFHQGALVTRRHAFDGRLGAGAFDADGELVATCKVCGDVVASERIKQAQSWLRSLAEDINPELRDSVTQAVVQLEGEVALRVDILATRLDMLTYLVEWSQAHKTGTRRDFALFAG